MSAEGEALKARIRVLEEISTAQWPSCEPTPAYLAAKADVIEAQQVLQAAIAERRRLRAAGVPAEWVSAWQVAPA